VSYPYGQDITYYFYPQVDNAAAVAIPTQNPTIYVFTDSNKPNRAAAIAGTNKLGSAITTWTVDGKGFYFTIPAISDPDVNSTQSERIYWLAINFILKSGGQTQTVIKALPMERVQGQEKSLSVTVSDLQALFPDVRSYLSDAQLNIMVENALSEIKATLLNKGFKWAQIQRPDMLKTATIFLVLCQVMLSQRKDINDNFDLNYNEFKALYSSSMNGLKLEYDENKDGEATEEEQRDVGGYVFLTR